MENNKQNKNFYFLRKEDKEIERQKKKWDQRFNLEKKPLYDSHKNINYLSLMYLNENSIEKEKEINKKIKSPLYSGYYALFSQSKKNHENKIYKKTSKNKKLVICMDNSQDKNKNNTPKKTLFSTNSYYSNTKRKKIDKKNIAFKNKYFLSNQTSPKYEKENMLTMDDDLSEKWKVINGLWNNFGVTKKYKEYFIDYINKIENKKKIKPFLDLEKEHMQKFGNGLKILKKRVEDRNNKIEELKALIKTYTNVISEINIYIDKNEYFEDISKKNQKLIISNINKCLLILRKLTFNVINQIKNISFPNSYFFYMNKIDLDIINNEYLFSIKNDLDFIQNSVIKKVYDFDYIGDSDPFFLSFSEKKGQNSDVNVEIEDFIKNEKKLKLPLNEEISREVQNCLFFLNQAEILNKTKNNNNIFSEFLKRNNSNEKFSSRSSISNGIGCLFKGNTEKKIIKLKTNNENNKNFKLIDNMTSSPSANKIKYHKRNNDKLFISSEQLKEQFHKYDSIKKMINENINEKVNENININNNFKKEEKEERKKKKEKEIIEKK